MTTPKDLPVRDFPANAAQPVYRADTPDGVIYAFRASANPQRCGFVVFGGEPGGYRHIVAQALTTSKWRYTHQFGSGTDDGWGERD